MKKGLLSLLAVALTVVSCQNYDDQFESLTDQITQLSTTVAGLTAITDQVTALQQTVNGLATSSALTALAGVVDSNATAIAAATAAANAAGSSADAATAAATAAGSSADAATAAVATVADQVASVQASITAILADLENVATAADLDTISATLAIVQADVKEILAGNAVINQNITINNAATLEYTQSLVNTEDDDPNVIVNGSVTINTTSFTPDITADQLAAVNEITAKLATILGHSSTTVGLSVTSATPLEFTNLTFIDDDYTISGSDQNDDALTTVTGDLTAGHGGEPAAFDYSHLVSIGGDLTIAAADAATATSINLAGVEITGDFIEAGQSPGNLQFEGATTIDLGTADFHKLVAPKASSIVSGMTTTASLTITAVNGGTIDLNSLTAITGADGLEITGTSTSVFHFDALTTVTAGPIDADNGAGEVHLGALTTMGGNVLIDATTEAALTSLVTTTAAINLYDTPAAILTNFVEAAHTFTWNVGVINLPNLNLEVPMSTTATNVTIKSFDAIGDVGSTVTHLTLTGQDIDLAGTDAVTDLNVTADGDGVDFASAGANLVNVTLSGTEVNDFAATLVALKSINLHNTSTNTLNDSTGTVTETVTLSGTIVAFTSTSGELAAFNNTANFLDVAPPNATPITIDIQGSQLVSVNLSAMEKVATVRFVNNSSLTELIAPSGASNLLTPGGGPTITINGNSITATYTGATAAFAGDGVNDPTPYQPACIYSPSLATWKDYIMAVSAIDTVTYNIDAKFGATADGYGEAIDADTNQNHLAATAGDGSDDINNAEVGLALIQATACD